MDQRDGVIMVQRGPFYDSGAGRIAYVLDDGIARRRNITTGPTISSASVMRPSRSADVIPR